VLMLDVGSLMGSLVGQSEERTRQALRMIDAMAPCVVMIDEVEKAFAGANSSGDSGVTSRMFGTFLSWLNDHTSDVFVVCTANDVSKLPPEFGRSERFDGIFFLDLPTREEKDAIWSIYRVQFEIDGDQRLPEDTDWTGAEIKACCRLAALLDVPLMQAAQNVVPVAVTAAESVDRLRNWASGRCLSALQPGLYHQPGKPGPRRKVSRDPSSNWTISMWTALEAEGGDLLTHPQLALLRAALQFFDEELGPHGINAMRPYFDEPPDGEISRSELAHLRELLRTCEVRYVCCDLAGTQVTHAGLYASEDIARSFAVDHVDQVATVLLMAGS
jgi:SpoVK/Ycf46/Vps4 family AAA+-type ATPase